MIKKLEIPKGIQVEINLPKIKVKGPLGEIEKEFKVWQDVKIEKLDDQVQLSSSSNRRKVKALIGTLQAHLMNMIEGVQRKFEYKLKVVRTHFPIRVEVKQGKVYIHNFLGERKPRIAEIAKGIEVKIEGDVIRVLGMDKELAGITASRIEQACKLRKVDRRKFLDGIYIIEKP